MDTAIKEENLLVRHATKIAIGTIALLMLTAVFLFWRQEQTDATARGWVDHTYVVRGYIRLLLSELQDAETGQRGYMLTDNPDFLEPYNDALRDSNSPNVGVAAVTMHRSIRQVVELLRQLTSDNPSQQSNIDELEIEIRQFLTPLASTIKQHDQTHSSSGIDYSRLKERMDSLRGTLRIMEAEETHLLTLRTEENRAAAQATNTLTFIALAIFFVVISIAIILYQRSRESARTQMLIYTRELERREEELKQQQEELKASNEEIEASNEELEEKTNALEEQNHRISRQSVELEETKRIVEEKANDLERASKYKSEFLANMSHELRTPLNSLLILARGLASNEDGNLTEEQVEEARVIHNGGLELLSLINDILDLSKVEAGKISVLPEDIYVENIVKRMVEQFGPVGKEKGLQFHTRIDASLPASLHTDGQRVEQILKNLLSNAFKFTEKGAVTLDIHRALSGTEPSRVGLSSGQAVALTVSDTGIGIDESKFRDIFEAFQQEDGSTDRHYGGTGLGLTIARKFAHLLGGEIHVASKKGEGSKFTLFLPLEYSDDGKAAPAPSPAQTVTSSATGGLNVMPRSAVRTFIPDDRKIIGSDDKVLLVIEDDKDFANTLLKIARKRGYKSLAAGDGKSGILLASEYPVTAIILDLRLPDIDGMCVLDQLKHNLATRHIPVHIITGVTGAEAVGPLKKGAVGCLTKPVQKEDIDEALARIEAMQASEVKKLLVVEDDTKTQKAVHQLLKQKNIEITFADTGMAALEKLGETEFDCIILDLRLPDVSGFEWLKAVEHALGDAGLPPTIIYTAKELTEEENRELNRYTGSIVIKGASSSERLLDEVTLFLHSVESTLSKDQREMIRMQHDPDRALQNGTVLLVDDDMRNTFALSKLLRRHGMNVVIADNGQMALEKLKSEKSIDLVIMDIMMPVMDGYQAMREIRSRQAWQNLPIIALTARAMPEEQERCIAAGANDYLTKPVDTERLLTLLRVWLFKQERAA